MGKSVEKLYHKTKKKPAGRSAGGDAQKSSLLLGSWAVSYCGSGTWLGALPLSHSIVATCMRNSHLSGLSHVRRSIATHRVSDVVDSITDKARPISVSIHSHTNTSKRQVISATAVNVIHSASRIGLASNKLAVSDRSVITPSIKSPNPPSAAVTMKLLGGTLILFFITFLLCRW